MKIAKIHREDRSDRDAHATGDARLASSMAEVGDKPSNRKPKWKSFALANPGDNSQRYIEQKDRSILCQGYAPTKFSTGMRGKPALKKITGFRLELLNDPNLPCNGPGRSFMGTCALSEFTVDAADAKSPSKRTRIKLVRAIGGLRQSAPRTGAELRRPIEEEALSPGRSQYAIDGKDDTAWGIDAGSGPAQRAADGRVRPRKAARLSQRRSFSTSTSSRITAGGIATIT